MSASCWWWNCEGASALLHPFLFLPGPLRPRQSVPADSLGITFSPVPQSAIAGHCSAWTASDLRPYLRSRIRMVVGKQLEQCSWQVHHAATSSLFPHGARGCAQSRAMCCTVPLLTAHRAAFEMTLRCPRNAPYGWLEAKGEGRPLGALLRAPKVGCTAARRPLSTIDGAAVKALPPTDQASASRADAAKGTPRRPMACPDQRPAATWQCPCAQRRAKTLFTQDLSSCRNSCGISSWIP